MLYGTWSNLRVRDGSTEKVTCELKTEGPPRHTLDEDSSGNCVSFLTCKFHLKWSAYHANRYFSCSLMDTSTESPSWKTLCRHSVLLSLHFTSLSSERSHRKFMHISIPNHVKELSGMKSKALENPTNVEQSSDWIMKQKISTLTRDSRKTERWFCSWVPIKFLHLIWSR
jgi:hypothetical protein